jgi:transposase
MERKQRRTFSQEFRLEALRLAEEHGLTATAERLGIGSNLLCKWRQRFRAEGATAFSRSPEKTTLEQELQQLRRENAVLREERDILKKAAAYFAKNAR